MKKAVFGSLSAIFFLGSAALAQTNVASIDPTGAMPPADPVVGQCRIVAGSPEMANPADGICIKATRDFVSLLKGKSAPAVDQSITDLVLQLAPLAQDDRRCDEFDDEVAAAIRYAAGFTSTQAQLAQLAEIAQTIADCDLGETALITPLAEEPVSP